MARTSEFWARFRKTFDPSEVLTGDRQHLYSTRDYDPLTALVTLFAPTEGISRAPRVFLSGHRGSGKSSLIFKLFQEVGKRYFVVYIDIEHHLNVGAVNAADVALMLGAVLFQTARVEGLSPDEEDFLRLERLVSSISTSRTESHATQDNTSLLERLSDLTVFGSTALGLGVAATILPTDPGKAAAVAMAATTIGEKLATAAKDSYKIASQTEDSTVYRREAVPQFQEINRQLNHLIDDIARQAEKPVLLVVDGFEKIPTVAMARPIFMESPLLFGPQCAMICSLPLPIFLESGFGKQAEECQVHFLPCIKLFERDDRQATYEIGYTQLSALVYRRLKTLPDTHFSIPEDALRRAIFYSGGNLRGLIRLLWDASIKAQIQNADTLTLSSVEEAVLDQTANRTYSLTREKKAELCEVQKTNEPSSSTLSQELLHSEFILAYRNQKTGTWFEVHPLLWEAL